MEKPFVGMLFSFEIKSFAALTSMGGEKHSSNAGLVEPFLSFPKLKTYLDLVGLVGFCLVWFGFWGRGGFWLVSFSYNGN